MHIGFNQCDVDPDRIRMIFASRIQIRINDADPGSKKSAKIIRNSHKNRQQLPEYHIFEYRNYTLFNAQK